MEKRLALNSEGWKIKTSNGFKDFVGVSTMGIKQLYKITFDDNSVIEVTKDHVFFTPDGREIRVKELNEGTELLGIENKIVISIERTSKQQTYDVIECESNHTYFTNGLLSHNCEFLSSDALLISSITLTNITSMLKNVNPLRTIRDVVFYEEIKNQATYLIGVDPATGSGEDYSTIEIFEFPSLKQVGEYRSNTMSTNLLYNVLKNVLIYLEKFHATVYFSIENNGVGEGVISLYEADENPPENAEFISEEGKGKRGMTTTARTKMKACVNLKEMIENGLMSIRSKTLLSELKSYVRHKGAYAAQPGSTDDLISSVLIVIRLVEEMASFDQEAFDRLYSGEFEQWSQQDYDGYNDYDENSEGMPLIF